MPETKVVINSSSSPLQSSEQKELAEFLCLHLEEYGDPLSEITAAIEYSSDANEAKGGYIFRCLEDEKLIGAVVVNNTGMSGYIPEYILVYIAVDSNYRGFGIGKKLMAKVIETVPGGIALHVEPENPAKFLYQKMGFDNKYLEMRYKKN